MFKNKIFKFLLFDQGWAKFHKRNGAFRKLTELSPLTIKNFFAKLVQFLSLCHRLSKELKHIDLACLKTVSSIFRTGSTLKCRNASGLDFTALTHLCFSVALYTYLLAPQSTCCQLWFLKSIWQNSHQFLFESVRPFNHSEKLSKSDN